jgi:hypothetical protein
VIDHTRSSGVTGGLSELETLAFAHPGWLFEHDPAGWWAAHKDSTHILGHTVRSLRRLLTASVQAGNA